MNILLTSVGRRTYMVEYFKKALDGIGKVYASNSVLTYSLTQADSFVITPSIYDSKYIDFLIEYCRKNSIDAIISLFDIDLPVLSRNKVKFEDIGVRLVVSNEVAIEICNDKWRTFNTLRSIGVEQPKTYINTKKLKTDLKSGNLFFPIIMKPRWGMGSIGIYQADNYEEFDVFNKKIKKEIFNTYLKFESEQDINECIIFQEKINGKEFGLDILNDMKGNYITTIAKEKLAMRAGETDIAKIVNNKDFLFISKKISNNLKHIGNLDVDCFMTDNNEILVLEMNCRFGGQYPFSHIAGANFPMQLIKWLKGEPTDYSLLSAKIGIVGCKELYPVIIENGK